MDPHLEALIENRNRAGRELDIHNLKGKAIEKRYEAAVYALQAACPHEDLDKQQVYFSGGYDYCASTTHNTYCKTCGFLVDTHDEVHHGRFG